MKKFFGNLFKFYAQERPFEVGIVCIAIMFVIFNMIGNAIAALISGSIVGSVLLGAVVTVLVFLGIGMIILRSKFHPQTLERWWKDDGRGPEYFESIYYNRKKEEPKEE